MTSSVRKYLSEIGQRGGRKSRRTLSPETARQMVRVREARRAYRTFYHQCFWSFDASYAIGSDDLDWVIQQLRRYGGQSGWKAAEKLCR